MITERQCFTTVVGCITVVTVARLASGSSPHTTLMTACALAQLCAMYGLLFRSKPATRVSHISFTALLWIGSVVAHRGTLEWSMILLLAAFTLATRRVLGHCMFSAARGESGRSGDPVYDLFYVVPLVVASARRRPIS